MLENVLQIRCTEASEKIEITREELDRLIANAPRQTITVDAAEYAALVASTGDTKKLSGERDRYATRCRDLEAALIREKREHQEEINSLELIIKKLKGHA